MTHTCPTCGQAPPEDGRATLWRVRVRLYRDGKAEPQADSDPEQPKDGLGDTVLRGLPAVAEHVQALAYAFHGAVPLPGEADPVSPLKGLELPALLHRLKSLRPTLSRRGGSAVWRVPYQVDGKDWLARVDIQRVAT